MNIKGGLDYRAAAALGNIYHYIHYINTPQVLTTSGMQLHVTKIW